MSAVMTVDSKAIESVPHSSPPFERELRSPEGAKRIPGVCGPLDTVPANLTTERFAPSRLPSSYSTRSNPFAFAVVVGVHLAAGAVLYLSASQFIHKHIEKPKVLVSIELPQPIVETPRAKPTDTPNPTLVQKRTAQPLKAEPSQIVPTTKPLHSAATVEQRDSPSTHSPATATSSAISNDEPVVQPAPKPVAKQTPSLTLPSSDADYLNNPPPHYPSASKKLNEQGTVIVRVLVSADGAAADVQLGKSSEYERLDEAALKAVRQWRFVPGKRDGVAESMWFNVPIHFVLK
jgi:periplasmic protein TonB